MSRQSTTTRAVVDAAVEWNETLITLGPEVNGSAVADLNGLQTAATADHNSIVIWTFDGQRWNRVATLATTSPAASASLGEIVVEDFTGDGLADFLIPLEANSIRGTLISTHGGSWTPVFFETPFGPDTELDDLTPRNQGLTSPFNDCDPSCADGQVTLVVWRYDGGRFVAASQEIIREATPPGGPNDRCDPSDGDPDCTDASFDLTFRIVEGFADCLATFEGDAGICSDLDGDGFAMYPDSG